LANIKYVTNDLVSRHRGTLPLLLTCPHDGTASPPGIPERTGVPGCDLERDSDLRTRAITVEVAERILELCGQTPYVVMADFRRRYIDVNRSAACAYEVHEAARFYDEYHRTLRAFVDEIRAEHGGLGWLIDVHGSRVLPEDPADVYLGTADGGSVERLLCLDELALFRHRSLRGLLTEADYVVSPSAPGVPEPPAFAGGFTIQTYGSSHKDGIDAIQVEITAPIRIDAEARAVFAEQLAQALVVLVQDRTEAVSQVSTGEMHLVRPAGDLLAALKAKPDSNDVQLRLGGGSSARGRLELRHDACNGPDTRRPGVLVLYDEEGRHHFLWADPQGRLRIGDHDPGTISCSGTPVGTQA
jgi:N-formylglutamate amidohydrolase